MTSDKTEEMNRPKRIHGEETRQNVLYVLRYAVQPIPPHTITKIYGRIFESEGKVDIRTIHRKLAELVEEGLAERKDGKYSLTEKAKSDIRYFARQFGTAILCVLMEEYYPTRHSIEENVGRLVMIFGSFLLFCFIETAYPIMKNNSQAQISGGYNKRLIEYCLQNIIPIKEMYRYFLGIMDYGLGLGNQNNNDKDKPNTKINQDIASIHRDLIACNCDENTRKNIMEGLPSLSSSPLLATDLYLIRYIRNEVIRRIGRGNLPEPHKLDTDSEVLSKFGEAFEKAMPGYFKLMSLCKIGMLEGNPKQKTLNTLDQIKKITN
jgi:hypothetical protein